MKLSGIFLSFFKKTKYVKLSLPYSRILYIRVYVLLSSLNNNKYNVNGVWGVFVGRACVMCGMHMCVHMCAHVVHTRVHIHVHTCACSRVHMCACMLT